MGKKFQLSVGQLNRYRRDGFIVLPRSISLMDIRMIRSEFPTIFSQPSESKVMEKDGKVVRSVYGSHFYNQLFKQLIRHPKLLIPAMQILRSSVYVYQLKVNLKDAFEGDLWDWHQDYIFWKKEDGLLKAQVVNVAVFLDEVNEFNGPCYFLPGSQREGVIDLSGHGRKDAAYSRSPEWISNLTANLKYAIDRSTVQRLVQKYGISSPKGPAGSVLLFHGNVVHGSPSNISPYGRAMAVITYSSVNNVPHLPPNPRPKFLVSRDYASITPLETPSLGKKEPRRP